MAVPLVIGQRRSGRRYASTPGTAQRLLQQGQRRPKLKTARQRGSD